MCRLNGSLVAETGRMMWFWMQTGGIRALSSHTEERSAVVIIILIEYKHFGTTVSSLPSELFIAGMSPTWARTTKGRTCAGWYVITLGVDPVDPKWRMLPIQRKMRWLWWSYLTPAD